MFKLLKKGTKFGIIQTVSNIEIVPFCHEHPLDAVDEWSYYQKYNTNKKQFLPTLLSNEEIRKEHDKLMLQVTDFLADD